MKIVVVWKDGEHEVINKRELKNLPSYMIRSVHKLVKQLAISK